MRRSLKGKEKKTNKKIQQTSMQNKHAKQRIRRLNEPKDYVAANVLPEALDTEDIKGVLSYRPK